MLLLFISERKSNLLDNISLKKHFQKGIAKRKKTVNSGAPEPGHSGALSKFWAPSWHILSIFEIKTNQCPADLLLARM